MRGFFRWKTTHLLVRFNGLSTVRYRSSLRDKAATIPTAFRYAPALRLARLLNWIVQSNACAQALFPAANAAPLCRNQHVDFAPVPGDNLSCLVCEI